VKETLMKVYLQKSHIFLDLIRKECGSIYGDRTSEINAKALLDIFLEVPPIAESSAISSLPEITREYCHDLPNSIEDAFNHWNDLVYAARTNDTIL